LRKKITQRLNSEKFDLIFVFSSNMAEYVRHVSDLPRVMDLVDVDSEKWRLYANCYSLPFSWVYQLEARRLARYEAEVAGIFDHAIFVSEKEASLFKRRVSDRPISVFPNGVDLDYFAPNGDDPKQPALVFTGEMNYFPNVDAVRYFCGEIFPLIRATVPDARFYIVGRNPTPQVRKLGRQPNVFVTGAVNDVRPYLAQARVAVAPLRIARGVQNKVLEAMAMGLPVVGTSVAFQGTQATVADGIRITDNPQEFAREALTFLKDPGLRRQGALQARRYVQRCHRWQDHGASLESLLQDVVGESPSHDRQSGR
jgi:sugar transferase (PEP-CTERM/EpsH1 system associated)